MTSAPAVADPYKSAAAPATDPRYHAREGVPCPLCRAADRRPVITVADPWTKLEFNVVACAACGFWYTAPRPTLDTLHLFYEGAYYDHIGVNSDRLRKEADKLARAAAKRKSALTNHFGYPGSKSLLGKLVSLPRAFFLRRGRRWLTEVIPWAGQGRLLDYGCGGCKFLLKARAHGWAVTGMDFSADVVKVAREVHGIDAREGVWPGPVLAGQTFDFISGWHVIEHVPDPVGTVKTMADHLAPGGYLLIACPNSDSWGRRMFGVDWMPWDVPRHFNHFTTAGLKDLLKRAGLDLYAVKFDLHKHTLQESARRRGARTGSGWWTFLGKRRGIWSAMNRLANLAGKSDVVIVVGRKPQPA